MGWRSLLTSTLLITLTIVLAGITIAHAISIAPKYVTIIKIPKSYGPCKKCRDLYLKIESYPGYSDSLTVLEWRGLFYVHFVVPWFPLSHYLRKLSYYIAWTGYSTTPSIEPTPDYDLLACYWYYTANSCSAWVQA